jgi:hypothetical protein
MKRKSGSTHTATALTGRYSGVVRNPHAYVPPAARKGPGMGAPGGFAAAAARGQAAATSGTATPPTAPKASANGKSTPIAPTTKASPAPPLAAPPIATSASNNSTTTLSAAPSEDKGLAPPAPVPARSTSDGPAAGEETLKKTSPLPAKLGLPAGTGATAMAKTESKVCHLNHVRCYF